MEANLLFRSENMKGQSTIPRAASSSEHCILADRSDGTNQRQSERGKLPLLFEGARLRVGRLSRQIGSASLISRSASRTRRTSVTISMSCSQQYRQTLIQTFWLGSGDWLRTPIVSLREMKINTAVYRK